MRRITINRGLDLPIGGKASQNVTDGRQIQHIALLGDDYIGMKPTMLVAEGDRVASGQALFTDKKNEGVVFTAPGSGQVVAINRGAKRKFESLVIKLEGDEAVCFCEPDTAPDSLEPRAIREMLVKSGLWCGLRTRPYGKIPPLDSLPASLFVTAIDSSPLGPDLGQIIELQREDFELGLLTLARGVECPLFVCVKADQKAPVAETDNLEIVEFAGPHPAGLPSTHIHFLDPVHEAKTVWHIGAQDVAAIGGGMPA